MEAMPPLKLTVTMRSREQLLMLRRAVHCLRVTERTAPEVTSETAFFRQHHTGPTVQVPEMRLTQYMFKDADAYGHRVALVRTSFLCQFCV